MISNVFTTGVTNHVVEVTGGRNSISGVRSETAGSGKGVVVNASCNNHVIDLTMRKGTTSEWVDTTDCESKGKSNQYFMTGERRTWLTETFRTEGNILSGNAFKGGKVRVSAELYGHNLDVDTSVTADSVYASGTVRADSVKPHRLTLNPMSLPGCSSSNEGAIRCDGKHF